MRLAFSVLPSHSSRPEICNWAPAATPISKPLDSEAAPTQSTHFTLAGTCDPDLSQTPL